ncbi:MAG: copper ion binding protein, partial [Ignavibacteria bacterium]|nr:copper ion binding protein [Ignavibacteria bacterium]
MLSEVKSHSAAGTHDPVCGMEIKSPSKYFIDLNGKRYEFCSENCQNKFALEPNKYIEQMNKVEPSYKTTSFGIEKLSLPINGLHCTSCVNTIEKEIKKLPGIKVAHVNYATETAHVEFKSSETTAVEIIGSIKKAGYQTGQSTLKIGIRGMYCGSCVSKIERELKQKSGVISASVDLGTESAIINYIPGLIQFEELKKVIEKLGYETYPITGFKQEKETIKKEVKESVEEPADENQLAREKEYKTLMKKFIFAAILSLPAILFSYPDLWGLPGQFQKGTDLLNYIWIAMGILSLPVMFWSGSQFYSGAWAAFKNRSANMHTLIATGISAAWLYSMVAVLFPGIFPTEQLADVFFDVVFVVVALVVLG